VLSALAESEPGSGDEILHRVRDENLAGPSLRGNARADRAAMPATLPSCTSHSPVWTPARTSSPNSRMPPTTDWAQRIARAGPSKRREEAVTCGVLLVAAEARKFPSHE
jgi:hypothetical protein